MEYFDVYDKNRIPLNYKKVRGEVLLENEFNTGVEVWITNDNKILKEDDENENCYCQTIF